MKDVASSWLASSHYMSSHDERFISLLLIISLLYYVGASVTAWSSFCKILSKHGLEEPPAGVQAWLNPTQAWLSCSITECRWMQSSVWTRYWGSVDARRPLDHVSQTFPLSCSGGTVLLSGDAFSSWSLWSCKSCWETESNHIGQLNLT